MLVASMFSVAIFVVVVAVLLLPYSFLYGMDGFDAIRDASLFLELLVLIVGVVAHEFIHGICWSQCVDGGWKTIKFGVMWKSLSPYCHCSEPMKVRNYRFGALAPLFVVGWLPDIIALIIGNLPLLIFGMLFTAGAAGDIMVVWTLRHEKADTYVLDHHSEAGCWVYREKNENH